MGGDPASTEIAIDGEVLRSAAQRLDAIAGDVRGTAAELAAPPITGRAFGVMNAWMVPPLGALASRSSAVVRATGELTAAVATATSGAADDFQEVERRHVGDLEAIEAGERPIDLDESRRFGR